MRDRVDAVDVYQLATPDHHKEEERGSNRPTNDEPPKIGNYAADWMGLPVRGEQKKIFK